MRVLSETTTRIRLGGAYVINFRALTKGIRLALLFRGRARTRTLRGIFLTLVLGLLATTALAVLPSAPASADWNPPSLGRPLVIGSNLYESVMPGDDTDTLYRYDGSEFVQVGAVPMAAGDFTSFAGTEYFTGRVGSTSTNGLYTFDGTNSTQVTSAPPNAADLFVLGGTLYVAGDAGTYDSYGDQYRELFATTDGVTFTAVPGIYNPKDPVVMNGKAYMSASSGEGYSNLDYEYVSFDGSTFYSYANPPLAVEDATVFNNKIFYYDASDPYDLSEFNGSAFINLTQSMTLEMDDTNMVVDDGKLYFGADTGSGSGWYLYSYDGSSFAQLNAAYSPSSFAVVNNVIYYYGENVPQSLWTTFTYQPPTPHLIANLPTITGNAVVGQTLTGHPDATWPAGTTFTYEWFAGGHSVGPASSSDTYTIQPSDVGAIVALDVYGTEPGYGDTSSGPAVTADVLPTTLPTSTATISGTAQVNGTLTVTTPTWPSSDGLTFQWTHNGQAIPGATNAIYRPTSYDTGQSISAVVTEHAVGYYVESTISPAVRVLRQFTSVPRAIITGTADIGHRLTATSPAWGPGHVTFKYQWLRNGVAIAGATESTFVPNASDLRREISVRVTGSEPGYVSQTATSAARVIL